MKKLKVLLSVFLLFTLVITGGYFLRNKIFKPKKDKIINIYELSEEFMDNYFEESSNIKSEDKSNMLIVTSLNGIKEDYGATNIIESPNNQYILQYASDEEKNKALNKLKNNGDILAVEENILYTVNETEYNSWGINKMVLDNAIEIANEKNLPEVVVAVLDTGCDMDLANKYYPGKIKETYNVLTTSTNDMSDVFGHGTHVLGTIAEGTPNNVKIIPIKLSDTGELYNTDIIAGINYVTYYEKADVMNMSFGGYRYTQAEETAINAANEKNIISVAAAGNDNSSSNHYPSAFENVISIASVDSELNKSTFSNWGSQITFAAPGTSIKSIMNSSAQISGIDDGDDDYETISGTSMATPHAVNAVALLKSYNKDLTYSNVIDLLKRTAIDLGDSGWDRYFGYGFISFANAEFCDGNDCDDYNVFKKTLEEKSFIKVEAQKYTPTYNYGNITNIMNAKLNIYYSDTAYYTKQLWELENLVISGYNPESYTVQQVNINYNGKSAILTVDNRGAGTSGWEYEQIDENKIRLTKLNYINDSPKKIYIPNEYDGYTVEELGNGTQSLNCFQAKFIVLPNTIAKINDQAFNGSNVVKVETSGQEIEIGAYAFYDAEHLTTFTGIIKSMGNYAFANCKNLDNIVLSYEITEISEEAFYNDINLEHINIPNSITYIGKNAFFNTNIRSIVIPSGITKIEMNTFNGCLNLESISLPESITEIDEYAFSSTSIRNLFIPKNVVTIDETAFSKISSLEEIIVDDNNSIYDSRDSCNAIIETETNTLVRASNNTIIPETVTKLGNYSYSGIRSNYKNVSEEKSIFEIPNNIVEIGAYTFWQTNYNSYKVPSSVTMIGEYAFDSNSNTIILYSDSYAKTYATENGYKYRHLDPTSVFVALPKKQYIAFESVDTTDMTIFLIYEEEQTRREYYDNPEEFNIVYNNNNNSFRYGDTYFTVSLYTKDEEYIEKNVNVTISKAIPSYVKPINIVAETRQKLLEISLPDGFEWMNPDQTINETGDVVYLAKFTPADINNYEIIENIEITVTVTNPYVRQIIFNPNGGTGIMNAIKTEDGNEEILPVNTFTREKHRFVNWNTKEDGTGTTYIDEAKINVNSNLTLYAQWEQIKHTVTFHSNYEEIQTSIQEIIDTTETELISNPYVRAGYIFIGWNTESDGSGTTYNNKQVISLDSDLELYAQWTKAKYKVTFNANGGTGTMNDQTYTYEQSKALSANTFTRDKYKFVNWNTKADGSGTTYNNKQVISLDSDLELYAQWEKEPTPITNISLNETEISLTVGQDDTKVLKATLEPSNTTQDTTVT
ncbi:MAG: leucine-rich repeat protein, partial [Bacilli bacterium]|nr:leucine-rich repeat protein [Bacilli bacterium]